MKRTWSILFLTAVAVLVVAVCGSSPVAAQDKPGVTVTVYNQGYAVVKDDREIDIPKAESVVKFSDVAQHIDPTSVYFKSLTDPDGTTVLEQNYEYDLVSADKLLHKYIDKPIKVFTKTGGNPEYDGTLLSYDGSQLVIKGDKSLSMIQRPDNVQDIQFGSLPEGLLTRPTLVWTVAAQKPGKQLVRVAYQTTNMEWRADYNIVVNKDDTKADVGGWVTVTNQSGATYKDARLKLIAGDVRRVVPQAAMFGMDAAMAGGARRSLAQAAPQEKAFFEYHLYTFPRKTTLADNQIKQLELLQAADVGVEKVYLYRGSMNSYYGGFNVNRGYGETDNKKVNVRLEIMNTEGNHLGKPLPAGKVRVFKKDEADNSLEFVGEDQIDHTKVTDKVKLYVGDAFDLNGERKVMDFKVEDGRHWMEEKIQITLTSAKTEEVALKVEEKLSRARNWSIIEKSDEFAKTDANTMEFVVKVPAKKGDEPGKKVITYTVDYTW
jgi:hypothetical protein